METSDLTGDALDWAVGVAEGEQLTVRDWFPCVLNAGGRWNPSSNWSQGGPIIERECVATYASGACSAHPKNPDYWVAEILDAAEIITRYGPTPLVAAMRCFVASKFGDEVAVPAILTQLVIRRNKC